MNKLISVLYKLQLVLCVFFVAVALAGLFGFAPWVLPMFIIGMAWNALALGSLLINIKTLHDTAQNAVEDGSHDRKLAWRGIAFAVTALAVSILIAALFPAFSVAPLIFAAFITVGWVGTHIGVIVHSHRAEEKYRQKHPTLDCFYKLSELEKMKAAFKRLPRAKKLQKKLASFVPGSYSEGMAMAKAIEETRKEDEAKDKIRTIRLKSAINLLVRKHLPSAA